MNKVAHAFKLLPTIFPWPFKLRHCSRSPSQKRNLTHSHSHSLTHTAATLTSQPQPPTGLTIGAVLQSKVQVVSILEGEHEARDTVIVEGEEHLALEVHGLRVGTEQR